MDDTEAFGLSNWKDGSVLYHLSSILILSSLIFNPHCFMLFTFFFTDTLVGLWIEAMINLCV